MVSDLVDEAVILARRHTLFVCAIIGEIKAGVKNSLGIATAAENSDCSVARSAETCGRHASQEHFRAALQLDQPFPGRVLAQRQRAQ
jgi:hypothetical protein